MMNLLVSWRRRTMFSPYRTTAKLTRTRAAAAPKDRIQIQLADDGNRFYELGNTQEDGLDRVQIYGYLITASIAPTRISACH
jgi:hypothetical protein